MHLLNGREFELNDHELKWHVRYLELAAHISQWSKDPSTKVGAVLVGENRKEYIGYNGFPPGVEDTEERLNNREERLLFSLHAEQNCFRKAGDDTVNATLYVYPGICGVPPTCVGCTREAAGYQIGMIVGWLEEVTERWHDGWVKAKKICDEAGIDYLGIDKEEVLWHLIY